MARLLRLLPDPACAHDPGSVDPPEVTFVSLAAVEERAQPLQRTAPSGRTKVQCSGRGRFADGVLAHVRTSGGSTSTAQPLLRLPRSSPPPPPPSFSPASMFLPQLNLIEPPWYGPVCQVVWEGWHCEVSPYPDQSKLCGANDYVESAATMLPSPRVPGRDHFT